MKSSWMVNHLCSHSFPLEITWRAIISHPHIGKTYVSNKVEGWNKPLQQQVTQLCPTLCNPMDSFPPASPVHGILQARILEWVAIPFSRGSSQPKGQTQVSCMAGGFFTAWATREAPRPPPPATTLYKQEHPKASQGAPGAGAQCHDHSPQLREPIRQQRSQELLLIFAGRWVRIHSPPKLAAEIRPTWLPTSLRLHTPSSGSCVLSACLIFFFF